jgi:hypothetical protein
MILDDLWPHLRSTLFITGAFCTAWSWDLVYYGASHAWAGENPLQNQISFGDQKSPKHLLGLLFQYLLVCGLAAVLSDHLQGYIILKKEEDTEDQEDLSTTTTTRSTHHPNNPHPPFRPSSNHHHNNHMIQAATTAIEFFPSPVFAGKLMSYLGQFGFGMLSSTIINLAATWFAASLAHAMPMLLLSSSSSSSHSTSTSSSDHWVFLQRFSKVVQNTLGFGLGIAWNVFTLQHLGPSQPNNNSNNNSSSWIHLLALFGYLCMVTLIAFRIAALVPEVPATLYDRQLALLSFASAVACAFTLVGFLAVLLVPGWMGSIQGLLILLGLSAGMSALVTHVDLTTTTTAAATMEPNDDSYALDMANTTTTTTTTTAWNCCLRVVVFIPCVWCCCPWIPIVLLLAGTSDSIHVKKHWFQLIALVSGLACSIEASGMVTKLMDLLAGGLGVCQDGTTCHHPWIFVSMQILFALLTTTVLIPEIAPLLEEEEERAPTASTMNNNNNGGGGGSTSTTTTGEQQALLV